MIGRKGYIDRSDEELMGFLRKKDQKAFEVLYERYSERMVNYFYKMLWQDEEKAQDFMQDLFTKIIEKPESFDVKRNFKTWFFSIANNMCKNEYRKQGIRSEVHGVVEHDVKGENGEKAPQSVDHNNFKAALDEALNELDETKKNTFLLRYQDEMSIKEISEVMECSEGTVKSRLFYTLKVLNEKLKVFEGLSISLFLCLSQLFEII